jgi:hypothetical protein
VVFVLYSRFTFFNTHPVPSNTAAVSSYLTVTNTHIYSMGGPTGEIHLAPNATSATGFGEKIQEMVYVPDGQLEAWDKTNKALVGFWLGVCNKRPSGWAGTQKSGMGRG